MKTPTPTRLAAAVVLASCLLAGCASTDPTTSELATPTTSELAIPDDTATSQPQVVPPKKDGDSDAAERSIITVTWTGACSDRCASEIDLVSMVTSYAPAGPLDEMMAVDADAALDVHEFVSTLDTSFGGCDDESDAVQVSVFTLPHPDVADRADATYETKADACAPLSGDELAELERLWTAAGAAWPAVQG